MNKSLLVAIAILLAGFSLFADELDGNASAANQTTRVENNIPQTVVVKKDKDGALSIFKSDAALNFKNEKDAQSQLAKVQFEKIAMESPADTQKLGELDRDQSDSSWHYYYPHNRYGGGFYFGRYVYTYAYYSPVVYYPPTCYGCITYYDYYSYVNYAPIYPAPYYWGSSSYVIYRPQYRGYYHGGYNGGYHGYHGGHGGWHR